jgi:hypothetical protein
MFCVVISGLTCSDDSSEGDYDPTRECFIVELAEGQIDDAPSDDNDDAPSDDNDDMANPPANLAVVPAASRPAASASSVVRQAQLAQLQEFEGKLEEERRQTQRLRAALEQEHTGRCAGARAAGSVAWERILADDDVDNPLDRKRASQKLVTAAYLLQAMPRPSTPEGHNLRDEARVLIEQAAVQQAESSASRMRSVASAKAGGTAQQDHEASVHTPPGGRGKAVVVNGAKAPSVHDHDRIKRPPVKERIRTRVGTPMYDEILASKVSRKSFEAIKIMYT